MTQNSARLQKLGASTFDFHRSGLRLLCTCTLQVLEPNSMRRSLRLSDESVEVALVEEEAAEVLENPFPKPAEVLCLGLEMEHHVLSKGLHSVDHLSSFLR